MKRFPKYFLLLTAALFLLLSGFSWGQSSSQDVSSINRVGTTAAQFLKIGAGARPIGMGGAYTALANDILSIYWNPAGLSRVIGNGEAAFNHAEWLAETNYDFAAFSMNVGSLGSFGFQIISFGTPEEPVRTVFNPEGTGQMWDANMISLGATYAKNLTDEFSIGFTAKYVQENIFDVSAKGAAVDFGVLYRTPFKDLTLGASISNFGTKMRLDGKNLFFNEDPLNDEGSVDGVPAKYRTDSFDMPLNLKFGLAWQVMRNEDFSLVAAADGVQPNDNSEYVNTGVELGVKNVIFLRGGYKALLLEDSEEGLTFGVGLKYNAAGGTQFKFDFGWADYGRLEDVKFVSFAIRY